MDTIPAGAADMDRHDRQRRIDWVDMDGIRRARVLVAGAGALGNEVVKNLVLAGFRHIDVIDMDDVVLSNLSRCLFFRDTDVRSGMKSEIVAERARALDPDAEIRPIVGRVQDIEDWDYDIILGCLDNILARMHLNASACGLGIPYIDGATDGMAGKLQVVLPGRPCLQCASNRSHAKALEKRFTCTGSASVFVPHTASDITTTSVIAAMEVREAMKAASDRQDLCTEGVTYYDGTAGEMFTLELDKDPQCPNHTED
ncbi:MAG: ThiF family adenylyltransferase [Candidatus Methanomethylophilaceae archaeon]|nr:ThiF family adenylyltransferase [Candidatus Methanomethylophilaceae archaeon]